MVDVEYIRHYACGHVWHFPPEIHCRYCGLNARLMRRCPRCEREAHRYGRCLRPEEVARSLREGITEGRITLNKPKGG